MQPTERRGGRPVTPGWRWAPGHRGARAPVHEAKPYRLGSVRERTACSSPGSA